jgi:hypothetical protein
MIWLILLWSTALAIAFIGGLYLGSALCNRRWAEKCARCQAIVRSSIRDGGEPRDKLHVRPRRSL